MKKRARPRPPKRPARSAARLAQEAAAIKNAIEWEREALTAPSLWMLALEWRAPIEYGALVAAL